MKMEGCPRSPSSAYKLINVQTVPNLRTFKIETSDMCLYEGLPFRERSLNIKFIITIFSSTLVVERHITLTTKTSTQDTVWIPRNVAN